MEVIKLVANRQLAQYNSDDRNINVTSKDTFQDVFQNIIEENIITINNQTITIQESGSTKRIDFQIEDLLLKKMFPAYFARNPRELRLQLLEYVEYRKIIPGDIITLFVETTGTNCTIQIKSDPLYRYVLERKSQRDIRYRILIEHPEGTRNAQITVSEYTNDYLAYFNIEKLEEPIDDWGNPSFTAYRLDGCTSKYIGVPYNKNLTIDCFDDIEEIVK